MQVEPPERVLAIVGFLANLTMSPEVFDQNPPGIPPGTPPDGMSDRMTGWPWPLAGDVLLVGQHVHIPEKKRITILDLQNSTEPFFTAALPPATDHNSTAAGNHSVTLILQKLTLHGLGVKPLRPEPGAAVSALPLWALQPLPYVPPAAQQQVDEANSSAANSTTEVR